METSRPPVFGKEYIDGFTNRPVWSQVSVPAFIGHRGLQLPLQLLLAEGLPGGRKISASMKSPACWVPLPHWECKSEADRW